MPHETILLIEDERDIRELIRYNLDREGFRVLESGSAESARKRLEKRRPDLIVLDLMLPGIDGITFCKELRADASTRSLPVLMLTARGEDADIVVGLEVGADDYLTKPFSPRVLVARVRALLRRRQAADAEPEAEIVRGSLTINPGRHEARLDDTPLPLTFSEFRMLEVLARRPGIVFSRYQIVDAVRGADYAVTDRAVDVQIVGLRRKLGRYSDLIETVRGVGYRFTTRPDACGQSEDA